jgi:hypothetical protein
VVTDTVPIHVTSGQWYSAARYATPLPRFKQF